MEKTENKVSLNLSSPGEAAVDGLFAGVIAGMVMAFFLLIVRLFAGQGLIDAFSVISVGLTPEPSFGVLSHLAISGVYGIAYGLLDQFLLGKWLKHFPPASSILLGLIYGVVLWSIAVLILLPGTASPMRYLPTTILLASHLIYGLVVGFLAGRRAKT